MRQIKKIEDFFKPFRPRAYKKGQIILHSGDVLTQFCYLHSGYIKIYNILDSGEERILVLLPKGEAFPLPAFMYRARYVLRYFYEALTDVKVSFLSRQKLAQTLEHNVPALQVMLNYITYNARILTTRLETFESKHAADKLRSLMPHLARFCGKLVRPKTYQIQLKITQQDMAAMVGLTRETTSIEINKLEKKGLISYQKGKLLIHSNKFDSDFWNSYYIAAG
ncbi:Crp/Fnr family transcriptional regulator [Candidatus Microgenomates bacterium]|nr:Crp/Fnr family transcriptional regulator [Candidatus Microgenomates bacterium]